MKKLIKQFKATFSRFNSDSPLVFLYDLSLFAVIIACIFGFYFLLSLITAPLLGIDLSDVTSIPQHDLNTIKNQVIFTFFALIGLLILLYALIIFFFSLFSSLAWHKIEKTKLKFKKLLKIFGLNLWFLPIYSAVFTIIIGIILGIFYLLVLNIPGILGMVITALYFILILFPAAIYLMFFLNFVIKNTVKLTPTKALISSFSKQISIKKLFSRSILLSIVFYIVSTIIAIIIPEVISIFISLILLVLLVFFQKYYLLEIISKEKRK